MCIQFESPKSAEYTHVFKGLRACIPYVGSVVKLPRSPPPRYTARVDGDYLYAIGLNYSSCHRPRPGVPAPLSFAWSVRFHLVT